jgi:hypothetical protein
LTCWAIGRQSQDGQTLLCARRACCTSRERDEPHSPTRTIVRMASGHVTSRMAAESYRQEVVSMITPAFGIAVCVAGCLVVAAIVALIVFVTRVRDR